MVSPRERRLVALTLLAVLPLLVCARWFQSQALAIRDGWPPVEEAVFVPDPRLARLLAVGYNEAAADVAWARLLVYYGEGMTLKGSRLGDVEPLLALVNSLDPYFRKPYSWGAYAVTYRNTAATQAEFESSIRVLERGVKYFPGDWELWWILGIRLAYDLKSDDPAQEREWRERAADALERAMRTPGAPDTLALQVASLRTKLGQHDRALKELQEMILSTSNDASRAQLIAKYESMLDDVGAGRALEEAAVAFRDEWQKDLGYLPETLYVIVGPRPEPMKTLASVVDWERVEVQDVVALDEADQNPSVDASPE